MIRFLCLASIGLFLGCSGSPRVCDCPKGCCDTNGECRPGTALDVCGGGGAACSSCGGGQQCVLNACSGAGGGGGNGGGMGVGGGGGGGGASLDAGAGAQVVINEICARGCDYLELLNAGTSSANLGDWSLADSESDGGAKVSEAVKLSAGTTLAAGERLLVLAKVEDGGTGTTTDCLGSGLPQCWRASFGVSNSRGEGVFLLGPSNQVAATVFYPIDGHASGQSFSRLPDGTGGFASGTRTPGKPNLP